MKNLLLSLFVIIAFSSTLSAQVVLNSGVQISSPPSNYPGVASDGANGIVATGGITANSLGPIYEVDQFAGADFGIKANACITAAVLTSGVCDARKLYGAQTSSVNITSGDGTHKIVFLWPYGTVTFAAGTQLILRSYSTNIGMGKKGGTTITCTNPTTSCVQTYNEVGGAQWITFSGIQITASGTIGSSAVGLQLAGVGYTDVLHSVFSETATQSFPVGTSIIGTGGCTCYNHFWYVDNYSTKIGILTGKATGFGYSINSNQWIGGNQWAPIGLWDYGTFKMSWKYLDFEAAINPGPILYANAYSSTGTGYNVGDTLRPAGGDSTAVLTVAAVSNGVPTSYTVTTPGNTYANGVNIATTTLTGAGSGATVDIRSTAYILELSDGGSVIENPYEEQPGNDYLCGTGNYVTGSWSPTNGSSYIPTYCTRATSVYSGPGKDMIWGPGSTPNSIGLNPVGTPYIAFGQYSTNDGYLDVYGYKSAATNGANLFQDGPAYNGRAAYIGIGWGHSRWDVGLSAPHAGTLSTGRVTHNQLANPGAPVLTAVGGTGTTSAAYSLVCNDSNGGATLPVTPTTTVSGPAVLGAITSITIASGGTGYVAGDVGKIVTIVSTTGTGTGGTATIASVSGGAVTGVTLTTVGSGYNTAPYPGTSLTNVFTTTGGGTTGSGLTLTTLSAYIQIAWTKTDGCISWTVLVGDTAHKLDTSLNKTGTTSQSDNVIDFGNGTAAYTPAARNTTADVSTTGYFHETPHTPATSSEACTTGDIAIDANFIYVCTATNVWKRAALTAF